MIWSPLRNKKMSDFLIFHSIIQAMQTRKKKLEKQFETCSVILCLLKQQEPHCLSSTEECFESPRWTPKSFKGTFVPRTGWRHFTQQMRDTLGVLNSVLGFFPQLPFFTVKWQCKHISLHHMNLELKEQQRASVTTARLPLRASSASFQALLEPRSSTTGSWFSAEHFHPALSAKLRRKVTRISLNFIYSIFQILLKISPFEQL